VLSGLLPSGTKGAFLSAAFTILFHFGSVATPKMGVETEENRAEMFSSLISPGIKQNVHALDEQSPIPWLLSVW